MSPQSVSRVSALDVARVEAWAASSFPDSDAETSIAVHARGAHIHVEEIRPRAAGGTSARTLVRFRYIDKTGTWILHRAVAGGRWIGREPLEGSLSDVLDAVDLRNLPPA